MSTLNEDQVAVLDGYVKTTTRTCVVYTDVLADPALRAMVERGGA